jgi:hypothetical protein
MKNQANNDFAAQANGMTVKKAIANRATVKEGAGSKGGYRVVEADGKPCMNGRNESDGGGFVDYAGAASLAREINVRRERKLNG